MMKWLFKFALEIAPPVAATVIGAFLVHQLWPSQQPDARSAAAPPAVQAPAESAKPFSLPTGNSETDESSGATTTATIPPSSVTGKSSRHSSEVAKTVPATSSTSRGETAASILERAEKALAAIPSARSKVSSPPPPGQATSVAPPAVATSVAPPTVATSVAPPTVATIEAPPVAATTSTAAVTTGTAAINANTATVTAAAPPPIDPPREIGSFPQATRQAPPPVQSSEPGRSSDRSPLRVYRSDRANLAEIPTSEDDDGVTQQPAATTPAPAPVSPPREKNIVDHIFAPLHSILPERLR